MKKIDQSRVSTRVISLKPKAERPQPQPKERETITTIRFARRVAMEPDAGAEGVRFELAIRSNLGRAWTLLIDPADLDKPSLVLAKIKNATGLFPSSEAAEVALLECISSMREQSPHEVRATVTTGWRTSPRREFVLPEASITEPGASPNFYLERSKLTNRRAANGYGAVQGTTSDWKARNGKILGQSTFGIACVGAALAAALLPFARFTETFVVLAYGGSSGGKSALCAGAMSIQQCGDELQMVGPEQSERSLAEIGANHNHMLMVVDDLSYLAAARRRAFIRSLTYGVSAGQSKTVSQRMQGEYPQHAFRTIVLTSSEEGADEIAQQVGEKRSAGEEVRLFDLKAAGPDEGGVWDRLRDPGQDTAQLSDQLKRYAKQYYSAPLRDWLTWLIEQSPRRLKQRVRYYTKQFISEASPRGSKLSGRQLRIAEKFGLLYAALRMARKAGVVSWGREKVRDALIACFRRSVGPAPRPLSELWGFVKSELRDPARAPKKAALRRKEPSSGPIPEWLAVKGLDYKGRRVIGIHPGTLDQLLGRDAQRFVQAMKVAGFLEETKGWQPRLGAHGKPRLLALRAECLKKRLRAKD